MAHQTRQSMVRVGLVGSVLTAVVLAAGPATPSSAAVVEAFTAQYDDRVWGDYFLVGNSQVECATGSSPDARDVDDDGNLTEAIGPLVGWNFYTECANDADRDTVSGGEANDERFMVFTNTDTVNPGIFNSSDVTLTLPPGSRIDTARLYWHGNDVLASGSASDTSALNSADALVGDATPGTAPWPTCQASFVAKNYTAYGTYSGAASTSTIARRLRAAHRGAAAGSATEMRLMVHTGAYDTGYTTITSADADISATASLSGHLYQQEADVTALLDAAPRGSAITITGANISTGEGFGCTGAWALAIVYSYPERHATHAPDLRRIQLYDGFAEASDNESADVELGGFLAAGGGAVEPRFGMVAYEGDQQITGDGLDIESWTQDEPRLSPTFTVTNNYATSTIGEFTSATTSDFTRVPNHNDAAGADIKVVPFDVSSLAGAEDGVTVNFSTTGDRYTPGVVVFSALESNITGAVFQDTDSDGARDVGEPGIANVTMTLSGNSGSGPVSRTTTTDADGNYVFDSVPDADGAGYTITQTQPANYLDGAETLGTAAGADGTLSAPNAITGIGHASTQQSIGYDFAELVPAPVLTPSVSVYAGHDGAASCPGTASISGLIPGDPYTVCVRVDNDSADATHLDGISFTGLTGTIVPGVGSLPIAPGGTKWYSVERTAPGTSPTVIAPSVTANPVISTGADLTGRPDVTEAAGSASVLLVANVSIGDRIFEDLDADGLQDVGEPGLAGATVTLYDAANTTAVTTDAFGGAVNPVVTSASGGYEFAGITPGQYTVRVTPPAGHVATLTDQGSDDTVDSDGAAALTPTLAGGADHRDHDIGFVATDASIVGNVWSDHDYDGIADPGEPGISGVTITLTGTDFTGAPVGPLTTATTGGSFSFTGLAPGTYALAETQPSSHETGTARNGVPAATPGTDSITGMVLGSGTAATGYGFADHPGIVSGIVFDDLDADGSFDVGEPGIAGVVLDLDSTTFTTAGDGLFVFPGLLPGTYTLTETQPIGMFDGAEALGTAATDSIVSDDTLSITLVAGEIASDNGFAEMSPATITGRVFEDRDHDGIADVGEPGIAGVSLAVTGPTSGGGVTDSAGNFSIGSLLPGSYTLTETQPSSHADGIATPAGGATESSTDTFTGILVGVGATSGGHRFGERPGSISGVVFDDTDGDGTQDGGEIGVAGVTIDLTGTETAMTTTDGSGAYVFANLSAGTYTVTETQPAGYDDGADTAGTSGGTVTNDTISAIVLAAGVDATGYTFAEAVEASVSGAVYDDRNANGLRDVGEPGLGGVTVTLGGTATGSTTTASDGTFAFIGLAPGTYSLTQTQPTVYVDGAETVGSAGGSTLTDDVITSITVASGQAATGYLFGEESGSISGVVFDDTDADGSFDGSETGIDAVSITVTGPGGSFHTTTAGGGLYTVHGLTPGSYTVTETQPGSHADWIDTPGAAGGTSAEPDAITGVTLAAGEDAAGYLFAEIQAQPLAGLVFEDTDADGILDGGELGIDGVTLTVSGADARSVGVTRTVTTGGGGIWSVLLAPGTYTIDETQPSAYVDWIDTAGTRGGTVGTGDSISAITMTAGQAATGYLFAEVAPASVAGSVVLDDGGNTGIDDVTLSLDGTDARGRAVHRTTISSSDGSFAVTGLAPGTYDLTETQPTGFADAGETAGTGGGTVGNDTITAIPLAVGADLTGYRFVEHRPMITGRVFKDTNGDARRSSCDGCDPGVGGVTVRLLDPNGALLTETLTAVDGTYSFVGLTTGDHLVEVVSPVGFRFVQPDQGIDGEDSDVAVTSGRVSVTVNDDLDSVDAGIEPAPVDLSVTMTQSTNNPTKGGSLAYTIGVSNPGVTPVGGPITVAQTLSAALRVDSVDAGEGWECTVVVPTVNCVRVAVLAPGQTAPSIVVRTTVLDATTPITASVQVSAPAVEATPGNNATSVSATPRSGSLPVTGGDVMKLLMIGLATIAAGSILERRARRVTPEA